MFIFEIGLLVLCCILLVLFIVAWEAIGNGLHVPYEPPIDWPVGHELYRPTGLLERRSWRARRIDESV